MNLLFYIGCAIIFAAYGYITLTPYRDTKWFIPVGLILALVANFLWMVLARRLGNSSDIAVAALVWDVIIVGTIVLMPAVLGIPLAPHKWVGIGIAVVGLTIALWG